MKNFNQINIDFQDIEKEDFKPNVPTIYNINWEGVQFNFLINYVPNSKKAAIIGTGAIKKDYNIEELPFFSRSTYFLSIPYTCIYYFDSTIYMYDKLNLGWGYGVENRFILENIAYLLLTILRKHNISFRNSLFFGNSGGGYQSILLATMLRGKALAVNPQLILKENYNAKPLSSVVNNLIESRISCVEYFLRERYIPDLNIKINSTSKNDITKLSSFLEKIMEENIPFGQNLNINFYYKDGNNRFAVEKDIELYWILEEIEKETIVENFDYKKKYKIKPFLQRVKEGYNPFIDSTLEREECTLDEESNYDIERIITELENEIFKNGSQIKKENNDDRKINISNTENDVDEIEVLDDIDFNEEAKKEEIEKLKIEWGFIPEKVDDKNIESIYNTVVFLDYMKNFETAHHFLQPSYFKNELKIYDMRKFQKTLMKKNYIKFVGDGLYKLTDDGLKFLNKYKDYIIFFNLVLSQITLNEYEQKKSELIGENFQVILFSAIESKLNKMKKEKDYLGVEKLSFEFAKIMQGLGLYEKSLYYYLQVLYLQTSGMTYYDVLQDFKKRNITVQQAKDSWNGIYIQNEVLIAIEELKESFFESVVNNIFEECPLELNLCTKYKLKNSIKDIIDKKFNLRNFENEIRLEYYSLFK